MSFTNRKNIGYHTRLDSDNTKKIVGGSFGGSIDSETVERLVNSQFTVEVKPSGTPVFVDGQGRRVSLYLSVDVVSTAMGQAAMKAYHLERQAKEEAEDELVANREEEIDRLTSGLSHEEIVRRLSRG